MNMTRRRLALAIAGGAAGAAAAIPAPAQNVQPATPDWEQAARAAHQQSAQALLKVDLPMLTEPAFQFRA
jgi:ABC-type proline/glycine betaine transport system substrate-binding protein